MNATAGAANPGMGGLLDQMGRKHASKIMANAASRDAAVSFLGPEKLGAQKRMGQTAKLLGELTNIPGYLQELAEMTGMDQHEVNARWANILDAVGGGGKAIASLESAFNSDGGFAGGTFSPPASQKDRYLAKYDMMEYITSSLRNGDPAFAQQMLMAAILPIAKEMIPNTVATKAFITDSCVGDISKPYVKKRRYKAYQQGLAEEVSMQPPAHIADYQTQLVTPTEWRRATAIDMKWIETMQFDVPADQLSDGGRELQVLIDQMFFRGLDSLIPNGTTPGQGTTVNGFTVDATQSCMMLEAGRAPMVEDLNYANQLLRGRGYNPDLIITSPFELGSLMSEQAVLMAYAYGSREVQETGMVGQLVGDAVAWTPNLYQGGAASSLVIWVVDSDELARIVLGWPISLTPDFRLRRMDFELYCRLAVYFRNTNAAVKIVCANADQGIT